ncbi:MAG: outer membrane lipoprotein carrier protein LolA [Bacteroidota bacterium]
MRQLLLAFLLCSLSMVAFAQKNTMSTAADSDPQATAILDKLRSKYENLKAVQASFSLIIEIPEQAKEVQKGTLAQAGDQFRLTLNDQTFISDGKTIWLHLKNNNEVQIMDATENSGEFLSPRDLMQIYEQENFVYALTNQLQEGNKLIEQIEFKPLDDNSDYSKLRLSVDKRKNEIVRIKAFGKDGARYTMRIDQWNANTNFPANHFTFDTKAFPDIYVEDLRY